MSLLFVFTKSECEQKMVMFCVLKCDALAHLYLQLF